MIRRIHARQGSPAPFLVLAVMVVGFVVVPPLFDASISSLNVFNVFQVFADYGLVALAVGMVIIVGGYDLSTATAYGMAGILAVKLGADHPLLGLAAALGAGALVGLVQGGIVAGLQISSLPVTLGGYLVLYGLSYVLTHETPVSYGNIAIGETLSDPILSVFSLRSLIAIGGFVVVGLAMGTTRFGAEARAVGEDAVAARAAGVRSRRVVVAVFVAAGLCTALGGSLASYSIGSATPDIGLTPLIFGTIAALLGGVTLAGGRGSVVGIAAGVFSFAMLRELLAVVGAQPYVTSLVTGGLLVVVGAVAAPRFRELMTRALRSSSPAVIGHTTKDKA